MQNILAPASIAKATDERSPSVTAADFKDVFRSIYQNRYFTNHGPLAKQFELLLEDYLDIKHVVAVGNESLALLIAVAGLEITGEIVIPAYRAAIASSVAAWLGLKATYCDVDPVSHQVSVESISPALTNKTEAVVLVETWGNRCDEQLVEFLTTGNLKVVIIAFDSFASESDGHYVIHDPHVITVHSFGPGQILTTLQGGSVATSNDDFAHRFRNIRSSYGVRETRRVKATCNGRFSEFQAGIGIRSLAYLGQRLAHYRTLASSYHSILAECNGVDLYGFDNTQVANGQFFPIRIKETFPFSRDDLIGKLGFNEATALSGGYFNNATRNRVVTAVSRSFPVAQRLSSQVLPLPINSKLDADTATQIAKKIGRFS